MVSSVPQAEERDRQQTVDSSSSWSHRAQHEDNPNTISKPSNAFMTFQVRCNWMDR